MAYEGIPVTPDKQGKVRDIFDLKDKLIIVATDRISAYDGVLKSLIPGKGKILNRISNFFFDKTRHLIDNHLIETDYRRFPAPFNSFEALDGRAVLVRKGEILPFECVVRGYLLGSAYKSYVKDRTVCGIELPPGLKENDRLPEPIFTPTTKAAEGHDMPVTFEEMARAIGSERAEELKARTLELYSYAAGYALERGIVLADTKLEFALIGGKLVLADEVFTPDSSRYFDAEEMTAAVATGAKPKSLDKQFVRDYLAQVGAVDKPESVELPQDVIDKTVERYQEVLERLTGDQ